MSLLDPRALAKQLAERLPHDPAQRAWAEGAVALANAGGTLDVGKLASSIGERVVAGLKPQVLDAVMKHGDLQQALFKFKDDVEATLRAASEEKDPEKLRWLQHDVATVLPARRAALVSSAGSRLAGDAKASFEAGLDLVAQVGVAVVRALVVR